MRTLRIYSNNIPVFHTTVLTLVIVLYFTSLVLITASLVFIMLKKNALMI